MNQQLDDRWWNPWHRSSVALSKQFVAELNEIWEKSQAMQKTPAFASRDVQPLKSMSIEDSVHQCKSIHCEQTKEDHDVSYQTLKEEFSGKPFQLIPVQEVTQHLKRSAPRRFCCMYCGSSEHCYVLDCTENQQAFEDLLKQRRDLNSKGADKEAQN